MPVCHIFGGKKTKRFARIIPPCCWSIYGPSFPSFLVKSFGGKYPPIN